MGQLLAKKRKTSKYIIQHCFVPDPGWEEDLHVAYNILLRWLVKTETAEISVSERKRRVAAT
jgi:hypothetical protein